MALHPADTDLRDYALGKCGGGDSDRIESHLAEPCERCIQVIQSIHTVSALGAQVATDDPVDDQLMSSEVASRFELLRLLADTSFNTVWQARDRQLDRLVVLKFAKISCDEARKVSALNHPGIVKVYDVRENDGPSILVLEYLDGGSLADALKDGPLEPRRATEIMVSICAAVQFAHELQFVHRDLKPDNILLRTDGSPCVADFGIAAQRASLAFDGGGGIGTRAYMAPEQFRHLDQIVDHRADLWSLGVIYHEMLTGKRPFEGACPEALQKEICNGNLWPRVEHALVDPRLLAVCRRCFQVDKAQRFQSAQELKTALHACLESKPKDAPRRRLSRRQWLAASAVTAVGLVAAPIALARRGPRLVAQLPRKVAAGDDVVLKVSSTSSTALPQGLCVVEEGGRLTIEGTGRLAFAPEGGLIVHGDLQILGTPDAPLEFQPLESAWRGLLLMGPGAEGSAVRHAVIRKGAGFSTRHQSDPFVVRSPHRYDPPPLELPKEGVPLDKDYKHRGGGVLVAHCRNITFDDVLFQENNSAQGGAMCLYATENVRLTGCRFLGNCARGTAAPGGAVYAGNCINLIIDGCQFLNNRAAGETYSCGGALYAGINSDIYLRGDCLFEGNSATYVGGAIYFLNSVLKREGGGDPLRIPATARLLNCTFRNNATAFWKWTQRPDYLGGVELFVNDGYRVDAAACVFQNRSSLDALIVGMGQADNPCRVVLSDPVIEHVAEFPLLFPNTPQAEQDPHWRGPAEHAHATDVVQTRGPRFKRLDPVLNDPIDDSCFRAPTNTRQIDTMVVHHVSALNWDRNDAVWNAQSREAAYAKHPQLRGLAPRARTFRPEAVKAIFEAYHLSSHYLIDRAGGIRRFVPIENVAYHAGRSRMPSQFDPAERESVNDFSVGVELVATSPDDDPQVVRETSPGLDASEDGPHPAYTVHQYVALRWLIAFLESQDNVELQHIVGHDEIAPGRKKDPGELFDWTIIRDQQGRPLIPGRPDPVE